MAEEEPPAFTVREIAVLKKIAAKRIAWGEVVGDIRWLAVYVAGALTMVAALKDHILAFLGLK